ncbi:pyridoxamine 5'-phosphate oxidase family protein [Spongiactinospora sp. TRM90649]|nr:MSMEG_1061 family FMN-dependent PPOX-type flavoprotein [Spongiactinospora sp. TRM90649]MDF5758084.1 pyridoxamine 5'-phosphate oxidase family protein [Spongiactinospora sp. TRM90649]
MRELVGRPDDVTLLKILNHLDRNCMTFLAHSPFCCMATADAAGLADCSPRGDYPGFARVLDERTIVVPDRIGNKIADSFENIADNPHVGLLFFVPGTVETLRVNGRAYLTDDEDLRTMLEQDHVRPDLALVVEIDEVYLHCGRALLRSRLWEPDMQELAGEIPSPGQFWADAAATPEMSAEKMNQVFESGYQDLY